MKTARACFALSFLLLAFSPAFAEFVCRQTETPPVIDGAVDEPVWQRSDTGADFMIFMTDLRLPIKAMHQTEWKMLHDAQNLYFGVVAHNAGGAATKTGGSDIFQDDTVEIFISFAPDNYFHLVANVAGRLYSGAKMGDRAYGRARLDDIVVRSSIKRDSWSVEMAVPLKSLGLNQAQLLASQCALNICRTDQESHTLSTWNFTPPGATGFHNPDLLRRISFGDGTAGPALCGNYAPQKGHGVLSNPSFLPSSQNPNELSDWKLEGGATWDAKAKVVALEQQGARLDQTARVLNLAGKKCTLVVYLANPSATARLYLKQYEEGILDIDLPVTGDDFAVKTVEVSLPDGISRIDHVGLLNQRPGKCRVAYLQLVAPSVMTFKYDPFSQFALGKNQAICCPLLPEVGVSPDMPLQVSWQNTQTFGGGKPGGATPDRHYRLMVDMPRGVKIESFYGGSGIAETGKTPIKRPEGQYTRYTYRLERLDSAGAGPDAMILTTDLRPGQERLAYYSLDWEGGRIADQKLVLKVIAMPKVRAPKRFIADLTLGLPVSPETGERHRDFDRVCADLKRLGLNTITLFMSWQFGDAKCTGHEFIPVARKHGFNVTAILAPFYQSWPEDLNQFPDAKAVDRTGQVLYQICPSYRGKFYRNWFEVMRMHTKHGISWLQPDWEVYNGIQDDICFCQRCKDQFRDFLAKRYPQLTYKDPVELQKKAEDLDLYHAWEDFKNGLIEEWLRDTKQAVVKFAAEDGAQSSPAPRISLVNYHWGGFDWKRLAQSVDYLAPMLYAYDRNFPEPSVRALGEFVASCHQSLGRPKCKLTPYLSPGERNDLMIYPRSGIKYQILEAVAGGAAGFNLYYYAVMDGVALKYMAEAIRMIEPVEDIILDGTIEEVPAANRAIKIRRIAHPTKGTVLFVSEYSVEEVNVEFVETARKKCRLIDLDTGETVARLQPGENQINIVLSKERARMLHYIDVN